MNATMDTNKQTLPDMLDASVQRGADTPAIVTAEGLVRVVQYLDQARGRI